MTPFLFEIQCPETQRRVFTGNWRTTMLVAKKLSERGRKIRIWKAPLPEEYELTAYLNELSKRIVEDDDHRPLMQGAEVMLSDFRDVGERDEPYPDVQPSKPFEGMTDEEVRQEFAPDFVNRT